MLSQAIGEYASFGSAQGFPGRLTSPLSRRPISIAAFRACDHSDAAQQHSIHRFAFSFFIVSSSPYGHVLHHAES